MRQPTWITEAFKDVGVTEIKGAAHNPKVVQYWKDIKRGGIKDDETPWCAAFVGAMLERVGIKSTRFEGAKSYLEWGQSRTVPSYGCIVVFNRAGGGHVGFVVGVTDDDRLLVLGGNQDNQVKVSAFKRDNVVGYRWPTEAEPEFISLPIGTADSIKSQV